MKLPTIHPRSLKGLLLMSMATVSMLFASCDSVIYDDEGDCAVKYRVPFRYTKNMLNADAFSSQVTDVNLYLFDSNGNLAFHKSEQRELTSENDYYMEVEVVPGTYSIIAWCEGKSVIDDAVSFVVENEVNPASMQDLGAYLPLQTDNDIIYSDKDINRFYYGMESDVEFIDSYGVVDISPVYLTKDTNHVTVQLLNADGSAIDPEFLKFSLSASNSQLDWQNNLTGDIKFSYLPWSKKSLSMVLDDEDSDSTRADDIVNGVQVELTTGRLMANVEQRLTVTNTDTGETVISIPLVKYLLLVRSLYEEATSDQDYLDRYDDFSLVFFVGDDLTWMKQYIYINNWRIVPPQEIEW